MPSATDRRGRAGSRPGGLASRLLPGRLLAGRVGAAALRPGGPAAPAASDPRVSRPRRPRPGQGLRRAARRLLALTAGASRLGGVRRLLRARRPG
ncbi:hypothetical protein DI273_20370 [Streptomyces violascens]|nr:hypothetical protein C3K23_11940 [Streptomyces sp. 604F]QPA01050.1 hypothetical protein DI273_20370 [Streptomyces violascens]